MKTQTIRKIFTVILLTVAFLSFQSARVGDLLIEIQVSPSVLNLNNQGEVVTVHTDIAYGLVVGASVTLNGIPIEWWKSDDRGNFVAKFTMEEVKRLAQSLNLNDYNTLTLTGITINGETFTGSDEIKIVKIVPKK